VKEGKFGEPIAFHQNKKHCSCLLVTKKLLAEKMELFRAAVL
jgi:hypothetical protein